MRNRAQTIGAALQLAPGPEGRGTAITLTLPPDPKGLRMIRVLLVDDHPALRAGLSAVLRSEPGIVAGRRRSAEELWPPSTARGPTSCCSTTTCRRTTAWRCAGASGA